MVDDELASGTSPSEKCIYGNCCLWPWPLNQWPWKCHQVRWTRYRVTVTSCDKMRQCTSGICEIIMPPKVHYVVSPWPWPLTYWPQNLIRSSLCTAAPKL